MLNRFVAALCLLCPAVILQAAESDRPLYELRIYTCEPGKLPALHQRFRDHTMRIFEKHGMKNVAYWTPIEGPEAETTLIYLLAHASQEAADKSWQAFRDDPEWKQVARESQEQHGKILAKSPERFFLDPTDYSPAISAPAAGKVYELRTYVAADGKLPALHARFRDHTDRIFRKHGMATLGYWVPTEAGDANHKLIYVIEHESRESAKASWKAFAADEEWKAAFQKSQADGSLTAARPEAVYMQLTDYSPRKK